MNFKTNKAYKNCVLRFNTCKGINASEEFAKFDTQYVSAIIKHNGMSNISYIIELIYKAGLKIEEYNIITQDEIMAKIIVSGIDAKEKIKNLIGNAENNLDETIIGKFGADSIELAEDKEKKEQKQKRI